MRENSMGKIGKIISSLMALNVIVFFCFFLPWRGIGRRQHYSQKTYVLEENCAQNIDIVFFNPVYSKYLAFIVPGDATFSNHSLKGSVYVESIATPKMRLTVIFDHRDFFPQETLPDGSRVFVLHQQLPLIRSNSYHIAISNITIPTPFILGLKSY